MTGTEMTWVHESLKRWCHSKSSLWHLDWFSQLCVCSQWATDQTNIGHLPACLGVRSNATITWMERLQSYARLKVDYHSGKPINLLQRRVKVRDVSESRRFSQYCSALHEFRPLAVDEGAEGQAIPPGRREVGNFHSSVPLSLLLTPGQQPARTHLWLCRRGSACQRGPSHDGHTASKETI